MNNIEQTVVKVIKKNLPLTPNCKKVVKEIVDSPELNQTVLADELGVNVSTISRISSGDIQNSQKVQRCLRNYYNEHGGNENSSSSDDDNFSSIDSFVSSEYDDDNNDDNKPKDDQKTNSDDDSFVSSEYDDDDNDGNKPKDKKDDQKPNSDATYNNGGNNRRKRTNRKKRETKAKSKELSTTTVFVTNLPFSVENEDFKKIFTENGHSPVRVRVISKKYRGSVRSRGYGFVEFENEEKQKAALQLDGIEVEGRKLSILIATKKTSNTITVHSDIIDSFKQRLSQPRIKKKKKKKKNPANIDGAGFIYVMTDNGKRFKVGSSYNPKDRLAEFRTANLDIKFVWAYQINDRRLLAEHHCHSQLQKLGMHIELEWFKGPLYKIQSVVRQVVDFGNGCIEQMQNN